VPTTTLDIVKAGWDRRSELTGELRKIDEKATEEKRDYTDAEKQAREEYQTELRGVDDRITANLDIELRAGEITSGMDKLLGAFIDRDSGEVDDFRSIGQRLASDEEYREWAGTQANLKARGTSPTIEAELSLRAVTDVTSGVASGGAFIVKQRLDRVGDDFLNRRVYLLDLLPTIQLGTAAVEYVQDVSPLADMANKAAEVTEAAAKPQAGPTLQIKTESAATIAAWANITRQVAADAPQVMGYLDGKLRYSLKRRADLQTINGDGIAPNLLGLANRTGILAYAPGAAEARYLSIRHGIRLMEDQEAVPEIIVLNPADAQIFDISNSTVSGLHAVMDLAGPSARTAWGLTQVRSTAIASGTALLIDPMSCAILDRMQATAYLTDSHASLFISNILTLLLESRVGLALFDPKGILKITFNGTV